VPLVRAPHGVRDGWLSKNHSRINAQFAALCDTFNKSRVLVLFAGQRRMPQVPRSASI
jgi:hypothetical protein